MIPKSATSNQNPNTMSSLLATPTDPSLLLRAGDFWWVWNELGKETSWLFAKVETEEDKKMPPVQGWQYSDDSNWQSDPTLEASRQVSKPCSEVLVELHGAAKEKLPSCAGIYKPLKGRHNRGRWVGSVLIIDSQSEGIGNVIKKKLMKILIYFHCGSANLSPPAQFYSNLPIIINIGVALNFFEEGAHH